MEIANPTKVCPSKTPPDKLWALRFLVEGLFDHHMGASQVLGPRNSIRFLAKKTMFRFSLGSSNFKRHPYQYTVQYAKYIYIFTQIYNIYIYTYNMNTHRWSHHPSSKTMWFSASPSIAAGSCRALLRGLLRIPRCNRKKIEGNIILIHCQGKMFLSKGKMIGFHGCFW